MKTSTKLIMTGAASLLGVALATGGAYAVTGSLTASDAPGQVLQVSGVGPASAHADANATANANANAKGVLGTTDTAKAEATAATEAAAAASAAATTNADSTSTASAVAPSVASQDASTVKGSLTGEEIAAWAHTQARVETVAPDAAVSVDVDANASVIVGE